MIAAKRGERQTAGRHGSGRTCGNRSLESRPPARVENQSEPRPQGSAEQSDMVVDRLRKWCTTTASPTPTAPLDAPSRSRLRFESQPIGASTVRSCEEM